MLTDQELAKIRARCEGWEEEWRDVVDCPDYQVSDHGNVRSRLKRVNEKYRIPGSWTTLKPYSSRSDGRLSVSIHAKKDKAYKRFGVSKLVMEAFVGPRPDGKEIAHLNGDASDNRLINLIYCTHKENESHKILHGTDPAGERNGQSKLQGWQVAEIKYLASKSVPNQKIADLFDLSHKDISGFVCGVRWPHEPPRRDLVDCLDEIARLKALLPEATSGSAEPSGPA